MKLTLANVILTVVMMTLASSSIATSQEQTQSATVSNLVQTHLWKDPDKLEGLKDVVFDFDTHESASEHSILEANAQWLKDHPEVRFRLSGYTDIRGGIVYNLALSQRRAETVKEELVQMGIAKDRIEYATGWGELYPNCLESTEECWAQQRRVEFVRAIK